MKKNKKVFDIICYLAIMVAAVLFLYIGNRIAVKGLAAFTQNNNQTIEAKVTKIVSITNPNDNSDNSADYGAVSNDDGDRDITFEAVYKQGMSDKYITAVQNVTAYYSNDAKDVEVGNKVILSLFPEDNQWHFIDYVRLDKILILGAVFLVLLIFFGRVKGVNAILSLCFTCVAIFEVFIPALLSGKNIYISAIIVCIFSIIVTLFMVNGVNKKSLAAVAGCFGGVIITGLLTLFMDKVLWLTGMLNEESVYLQSLPTKNPIDLKAIIFAGILIGAVGAVMDVAMSIASALQELKSQAPNLKFADIFTSGVNIGKDVMGTMINTLVLAYIGESLSVVLLLIAYSTSFIQLINTQSIIVELLQAIIGSLGILLTMPLTSLICSVLYSRKNNGGSNDEDNHEDDEDEFAYLKF
ncbi:MAG: YibE/F family protein [Oscillospiraceae bacterium]|nr:YibE/F family protein [Oscillospiraceae bacterium]